MATIAGRRSLFIAQRRAKAEVTTAFREAAEQISGMLARSAEEDGSIPDSSRRRILAAAGQIVQRLFVGSDGRNPFADDGVTPLAPVPLAIMRWTGFVTYEIAKAHEAYFKRTMPEDVLALLEEATRQVSEQVSIGDLDEQIRAARIFSPNALAQYEAPHVWVDPNGYTLSDRIWQSGQRTMRRVDAMLAEGIREGTPALQLARRVEQFLIPGRAAVRTRRPYGTDASADAMRLVRSEISRAHGWAALTAARMNPYVSEMTWRLSGSHPKPDICDDHAAASPYPVNEGVPVPVQDSHPHCLCTLVPGVTASPADVTESLRELLLAGNQPYQTPANAEAFTRVLLGQANTIRAILSQLGAAA